MDDSEPLAPEELDFRRDPSVTALGDGRYVVATARDDPATARRDRTPRTRRGEDIGTGGQRRSKNERSRENESAETETADSDGEGERPDYFVSIAARTDEGTFDAHLDGDDIGAVFAAMLRWYARCVSPEDDPAEVLSVLLSRSALSLTAPTADR
ncbi:hypothetical protein C474_21196 [Halogeometricum pallidum JCM 14848]|uniref:Uncharacterized protein n=1 Tax=Halogeometricum pallidum JCM 14848 TaxID=1227487 RepID=M0CWI0_HALPD|nr:hypothetical protein [Halogeometricum pallidum]ELZ26254.1 hypothetical protein C474_21196 [Halogeometricum pallidum JCM 14848]